MKNTYIAIVIVIVLAIIGFVVFGRGNKLEAPTKVESGTPTQTKNITTNENNDVDISNDMVNELEPPAGSVKTEVKATVGTVKEFTVSGKNFSFTPNILTVKKGDTVKITFKNENGNHDLRIDEFNVKTSVIKGGTSETVSFVADKTGSFQYYCSVGSHRANGMWGTLKVE